MVLFQGYQVLVQAGELCLKEGLLVRDRTLVLYMHGFNHSWLGVESGAQEARVTKHVCLFALEKKGSGIYLRKSECSSRKQIALALKASLACLLAEYLHILASWLGFVLMGS